VNAPPLVWICGLRVESAGRAVPVVFERRPGARLGSAAARVVGCDAAPALAPLPAAAFAGESTRWNCGVCFVDPERRIDPPPTLGRAWLLAAHQVMGVWEQENR